MKTNMTTLERLNEFLFPTRESKECVDCGHLNAPNAERCEMVGQHGDE